MGCDRRDRPVRGACSKTYAGHRLAWKIKTCIDIAAAGLCAANFYVLFRLYRGIFSAGVLMFRLIGAPLFCYFV
jgi:hypothetical protein